MSARYAMPFLQAPDAAVDLTSWEVRSFDSQDWVELGEQLPGWDPLRKLELRRLATVDVDAVKVACELVSGDALRLCVSVWSRAALVRRCLFRSERLSRGKAELSVAVTVEGGDVAGDIAIETDLVLDGPSASSQVFAPKLAGSRLWSDALHVELEGSGSQFPVESGEFSTMPWIPAAEAPWHLEVDTSDLDAPFLGAVRLFLNSGHPVIRELGKHPQARSMMNYDIARCLISSVVVEEEFQRSADHFARNSLGAVVRRLTNAFFPGMSIREIAEEAKHRPCDFDTRIRAATELLSA